MSNERISEQWYKAAKRHVDAEAAADLLEQTKSAVLSQLMMKCEAKTVAAKELEVKASREWYTHVEKVAAARKAANVAKVEMEFMRLKFSEAMSDEATERAQARL